MAKMEKLVVVQKFSPGMKISVTMEFLGNTFVLDEIYYSKRSKSYECSYIHEDDFYVQKED